MRDPAGSLRFTADEVIRAVADAEDPSLRFLQSARARELVDAGCLVPFTFETKTELRSPRYPFVTFPFEWSDAQLTAAGMLTLDISTAIAPDQYELKDASAWNVIFDGCVPVFCDHLSFHPIEDKYWWAFGQFARHFLLPLGLSRERGIRACQVFSLFRDGLPQRTARNWLGLRRFGSWLWPLLLFGKDEPRVHRQRPPGSTVPLHDNLYRFSRFLLGRHPGPRTRDSEWVEYSERRPHYSARASAAKSEKVADWLAATSPSWVVDLGANTGEFSKLALGSGSKVIAVDADHDSLERLFLDCPGSRDLFPLIANLGDLTGGRGWMGAEFPGLAHRLKASGDMVMMLALIHHLLLAEGVPDDEIAALAAHVTRRHAMVEIIDSDDPMVIRLAEQHRRVASDFSRESQMTAFRKRFSVLESFDLPGTQRSIVLMQKNP